MIPDAVFQYDKQIIDQIWSRKRRTKGSTGLILPEDLKGWPREMNVDSSWLNRFLSIMDAIEEHRPEVNPSVFTLEGIIPILRKSIHPTIQVFLTHMEQHHTCSVLHFDVQSRVPESQLLFTPDPRKPIQVDIIPQTYQTQLVALYHRGGIQVQMAVTPKLPDDISDVRFVIDCSGIHSKNFAKLESTMHHRHVKLTSEQRIEIDAIRDHIHKPKETTRRNHVYSRTLQDLDTRIVELVKERRLRTRSNELEVECVDRDIHAYAKDLHVRSKWLQGYLACVNECSPFREYLTPVNLLRVIYPHKEAFRDGIYFGITQVKQFINCSEVQVDVVVAPGVNQEFRELVPGKLRIQSPYVTQFQSSGGGGKQFRSHYLVTPVLPDDLSDIDMELDYEDLAAYRTHVDQPENIEL